jgi:hypothetical protein
MPLFEVQCYLTRRRITVITTTTTATERLLVWDDCVRHDCAYSTTARMARLLLGQLLVWYDCSESGLVERLCRERS